MKIEDEVKENLNERRENEKMGVEDVAEMEMKRRAIKGGWVEEEED